MPPSDPGVHEMRAVASPISTAVTLVGGDGATGWLYDIVVGSLDPTTFAAVTVNVYEAPIVNPVTLAVVPFTVIETVCESEVTVYPVITDPPDAPGVHDTVAVVRPVGVTNTLVGADGTDGCVYVN
jgi:hypothetical protein